MPTESENALALLLVKAIDVLSTNKKYRVSGEALRTYLEENCPEAKGEQSETFLTVTVQKALDEMTQSEMIEQKSNGVRLTENGLWSLLGRREETRSKRVMDPSESEAREPKDVAPLQQTFSIGTALFPTGSLLGKNKAKLEGVGVTLTAPQLLMEAQESIWSMADFQEKAGNFAPTLLLLKLKNGTECGGVAGVPWPKGCRDAADPAGNSMLFLLGATPARFDLVNPEKALYSCSVYFGFGSEGALNIRRDGECRSLGEGAYAGPREKGQLVGGDPKYFKQTYERWELWRL
jgi:hypothetical protein